MTRLSRTEQETVIVYNAEERRASITTYDPVMMRKLDKLVDRAPAVYKNLDVLSDNGGVYGKVYETDKKLLSFRTPRELTPEQKRASAERLAKARKSPK